MIYCVEDDTGIRELVVYTLNSTGHTAIGFSAGTTFFEALENELPELVLLDVMLPGIDGYEILKKLRSKVSTREIPVVMLTARGAEYDKVKFLDAGADDYVTKPFGMMELLSRVRAILRRAGGKKDKENMLRVGGVEVDVKRHTVLAGGDTIVLTLKEFELLRRLMENKNIVLTRDKLLESVWGYDFDGETRTVDVHVRTLRQKLGVYGDIIETVRGVGYRLKEEV
ncbi:MAG TPA: response regulator transcription factor [Clostridia bacterium]|nr:response regulator transcription factor [Clostridia bacterium]